MARYKTKLFLAIFILFGLFIYFIPSPKAPFNDLDDSDITSITVYARPPNNNNTRLVEDSEQIKEITNIIKSIETHQRFIPPIIPTYGQLVQITLNMKLGKTVEIREYGDRIKINGQWYKTKNAAYEQQQINHLVNEILETGF